MHVAFFSLILQISLSASGSKCPETTEKLSYEVINQFLDEVKGKEGNEKFKLNLKLIQYEDIFTLNPNFTDPEFFDLNWIPAPKFNIDTILSEQDFACLKDQIQIYNAKESLNRKKIRSKSKFIFSRNRLPKRKRTFPGFTLYSISYPLFSQDKRVAQLYVEEFCGVECGSGTLYLYKRDNDNLWSKIGSISIYIS
jgi:hypothetical protein